MHSSNSSTSPDVTPVTTRYRNYVLIILLITGIFAWLDRQIFSMLMQSIKEEFAFTDTQLGLLGGVAFALFYVTIGLGVAWLGDRYNRRNIISIALALWSAMTALCGFATGFVSLFLARVGVGIGEAGGSPPSQSLISDYFPPEKRGAALGVFFLYIPLGFLVGFLAGGWINELADWRLAFIIAGVPGIFLALLIRFTIKELPRGSSEHEQGSVKPSSLIQTIRYFLSRKSLVHIPLAGAIHGIGAFAVSVWGPSFFMRVHGMSSGEVGTWMALTYGIAGALGVTLGGRLADQLSRKTEDKRWYLRLPMLTLLISVPFAIPVYLLDVPEIAFLFLFVSLFFSHMFLGPVLAMVQALAGVHRRTQAAAFYLFLANLISMSLGPFLIGYISDQFQGSLTALKYSLLILAMVCSVWAALHFFLASKTLRKDLEAVSTKGGEIGEAGETG